MTESVGLLDPLGQGTLAAELTDDRAFLQAMVDTELALTLALVDAGLVPEWMAAVCAGLADASELDLPAIAAGGRSGGNPVIPLVKALGGRAERLRSGASDHLHVGTTSQDILDTATMLVAARVSSEVVEQLDTLAARLADLADRHRETVMVGRTLGQHASLTTFGLVVAGWLDSVLHARSVLDSARRSLPVQLGGAVGTLAVLGSIATDRRPDVAATETIDVVVARMARRLGLAEPGIAWHTARGVVAELASALSLAAGVAGKFALDVTVLSRTELAEVSERLGDGEGGSSAMPHKRNPVTAVLVTAAARQAPAHLATLHSALLAEDQRPSGAWHSEWMPLRALEALAVSAVTGASELASRLVVDPERMRSDVELTRGLVVSERVSTVLAESLGKAAAFELVGRASADVAEGLTLQETLDRRLTGIPEPSSGGIGALRSRIDASFDIDTVDGSDLEHTLVAVDRVLAHYRAVTSVADSPAEDPHRPVEARPEEAQS